MDTIPIAGPSTFLLSPPADTIPDSASQTYDHLESVCGGCKLPIDSDTGGVVVAFGSALWHTDCFRCAKCGNHVNPDTTLLLLADGSPICSNCSYNCNVCKNPILDEAIMAGDDAYHSSCFTCRTCHKRIEELVFAKTSQGIYCMDCHNDRVARSRRHAEQRAKNRSKRPKDTGATRPSEPHSPNAASAAPARQDSNSTPSTNQPSYQRPGLNGTPNSGSGGHLGDSFPPPRSASYNVASQPQHEHAARSASNPMPSSSSNSLSSKPSNLALRPSSPMAPNGSPTASVTPTSKPMPRTLAMSPEEEEAPSTFGRMQETWTPSLEDARRRSPSRERERFDTLPLPSESPNLGYPGLKSDVRNDSRRKSYDDGVRPLQTLFTSARPTHQATASSSSSRLTTPTLEVPGSASTTKAERRRSINPAGTGMSMAAAAAQFTSDDRTQSPAMTNSSENSRSLSPMRTGSPDVGYFTAASSVSRSGSPAPVVIDSSRRAETSADTQQQPSVSGPLGSTTSSRPMNGQLSSDGVTPQHSFPPRGQSLNRSGQGTPVPSITSASALPAPSTPARPPFKTEPSFTFDSPSDDNTSRTSSESSRPQPPPKDPEMDYRARSRSPTPSRPSISSERRSMDDTVGSPRSTNSRLVGTPDREQPSSPAPTPSSLNGSTTLAPPFVPAGDQQTQSNNGDQLLPATLALPPMRFSKDSTDFADLLKVVSDSPPRMPLPRESSMLALSMAAKQVQGRSGEREARGVEGDVRTRKQSSPATPERRILNETMASDNRTRSESVSEGLKNTSKSSSTAATGRRPSDPTQVNASSHGNSSSTKPSSPPPSTSAFSSPPTILSAFSESDGEGASSETSPPTSHLNSIPSVVIEHAKPTSSSMVTADSRGTTNGSSTTVGAIGDSYNSLTNGSNLSLASSSGSILRPLLSRADSADLAGRRLREALNNATTRGASSIKIEPELAEAVLRAMDGSRELYTGLKGDMDQIKRTSHQYMTGFTVAQEEYQKEVATRKDLQAEVARLRVQLSGQAARLTALTAEDRTRGAMERLATELNHSVVALERDVARIRTERDMSLAEIEELAALKKSTSSSTSDMSSAFSRSLLTRMEYVKTQYRKELEPLQEKRERLYKEIAELREARDIFLEETTALNTRNEQLAELNAQIAIQIENSVAGSSANAAAGNGHNHSATLLPALSSEMSLSASSLSESALDSFISPKVTSLRGRAKAAEARPINSPSLHSTTTSTTAVDGSDDSNRFVKINKVDAPPPDVHHTSAQKKFKWFGVAGAGTASNNSSFKSSSPALPEKEKVTTHHFTHTSVLRFSRCDQCGDKLWGAQLRCSDCGFSCHPRCGPLVKSACKQSQRVEEISNDIVALPPSMFGRNLIEQVEADSEYTGSNHGVPVIVEKCIEAVEAIGMDYEGIYRKTGGSSQSKAITQLFERGQYDSFNLLDTDSFNDISSVTSVLKNYFRSLPDPLLTFALHDGFITATTIKDPRERTTHLVGLVRQLPRAHYYTLAVLMLHLNRVRERSNENLMNARNLGVVFGPTLMRSSDPSQEFADMAGKALSVEWLVENAPIVFQDTPDTA